MKNQVLSIEQMKHLQELGVDTSKAKMAWYATYETKLNRYNELRVKDEVYDKHYPSVPTFTLQDMLEMMPYLLFGKYFFNINKSSHNWWFIKYTDYLANNDYEFFHSNDLLEAAYQCLCWLAENGYLKGGEK